MRQLPNYNSGQYSTNPPDERQLIPSPKLRGNPMCKPELIMRESTGNIAIETSYCSSCGFNHWSNIGQLKCERCGQDKAPWFKPKS